MEEKKKEKLERHKPEKLKKAEEKLPYCTTAPSAEHARAYDEDEPCDDGTAAGTDKD
jgi:hypothetical protein